MGKRFRTCDLDQPYLLPPCLQAWLPEGHLARFIAEVVSELDLSAIYAEYERRDSRGMAAYHPAMLTRLLLYAYCVGVSSSRKIEKATYENLAMRYLAADQHPDHDTIAAFRQQHLERLAALFAQALQLCKRAGLVKLGHVALDGTKIQANASLQRSMPYTWLSEEEQFWADTVQRLLREAEQADREEDDRFGKGRTGDELPAELAEAQSRLKRIRQAKKELEEEAARELAEASQQRQPRRCGRPRKDEQQADPRSHAERAKAKKRLQRAKRNAVLPVRSFNLTDGDSRVMRDNASKCMVQAYNAQIAVDAEAQVIVAADVTQQVVDRAQLVPMCERMRASLGTMPAAITADAGYWDTLSVERASASGAQILVAPDATHRGAKPRVCQSGESVHRMRDLLREEPARALYKLRKGIVEPVFGQIKQARGFRRFCVRSINKVKAEWQIICLTHNLLKLFRHSWLPQPA